MRLDQYITGAKITMSNYAVDPDGLFKFDGFHQVMVSTGTKTIYIAGQVAFDKDMSFIGKGDYKAQAVQVFQNIAIAAKAAGATPADVVTSVLYVKGLSSDAIQQVMTGMATALDGKPFPAHAYNIVGVEKLSDPDVLLEVSAVAVID